MSTTSIYPIKTYHTSSGTFINPYSDTRDRRWQLGVALPVSNSHFIRKTTVSGNILNISQDKASVQFESPEKAETIYYAINNAIRNKRKLFIQLAKLDRSNITNLEIKYAPYLGSDYVTIAFNSDITNYVNFTTNSMATIILPNLASDWNLGSGIHPINLHKESAEYLNSNIGDFYSQELSIPKGNFTGIERLFYQEIDLSNTYIQPNAALRIGCVYNIKCLDDSGTPVLIPGKVRLKWEADGDTQYTDNLDTSYYGNVFTVFNSNPLKAPRNISSGKLSLSFINNSGAPSNGNINFWLDEIWIEHDGGDVDRNGFITITNYPTRTSLSYSNLDDVDMTRLSNGDYYLSSIFGDANESSKWVIESEWVNTSLQTFNKFKYFESLCKSGSLINLHPALPETPECLTGKIVVQSMRKPNFSFNKSSFKVLFYEV